MKTRKEIRGIIGSLMQNAKYQIEFHRSGKSLLVVVEYLDYLSKEALREKAKPMLDESSVRLIFSRGYSDETIKDYLFNKYYQGNGIGDRKADEDAVPFRMAAFRDLECVSFCG